MKAHANFSRKSDLLVHVLHIYHIDNTSSFVEFRLCRSYFELSISQVTGKGDVRSGYLEFLDPKGMLDTHQHLPLNSILGVPG